VKKVHLRYENFIQSKPGEHPFSLGIIIQSLSAQLDTEEHGHEMGMSRVKVREVIEGDAKMAWEKVQEIT